MPIYTSASLGRSTSARVKDARGGNVGDDAADDEDADVASKFRSRRERERERVTRASRLAHKWTKLFTRPPLPLLPFLLCAYVRAREFVF